MPYSGAGLSRGLSGAAALAIDQVIELGLTCIAVDLPSGLHGDTGLVLPGRDHPGKAGIAAKCVQSVTLLQAQTGPCALPWAGVVR